MIASHAAILEAGTYGELREHLSRFDCRRCGLHAARTHIVVDRGNPRADLLFIGEGPGAEEDRQGQAFVGRSGKLLDAMLLEAGIDPVKGVLIANVVKCRPPDNRPPQAEEVEACFPYLTRQIELLRPKLIGLLGATAAKHMLRSQRMNNRNNRLTELVGAFHREPDYPDAEIMVLFHPAYILRNPSKRGDMVRHLRALARR